MAASESIFVTEVYKLIRCNMAVSAKRGRERIIKKVLHCFIFVNIVSHLVPCRGSVELQSKVFLNNADQLYNSGKPFQESLRYESPSYNNGVFFNPPFLDYGIRPVGMPVVQQIVVQNADPQMSLHLLSISGSSPHFHCTFFEDKLLAPLGNTTFEICFLAQNMGQIETTLYIHSSRGSFKYHVSGAGAQNPYRIKPFLGARVPLNSSFSPVIHLHNPHESVLQVQEIYSSGSDLHLELPSGQVEATKELWEIPPYETKPIMKANFLGRVENNHTVFIRIKTNKENKEEMLVVPVEVEVTSDPGLFSVTDMLDFGILRTFDDDDDDDDAVLRVDLFNSQLQPVQITNVTMDPPNEAIQIDFMPTNVKYDIINPTSVALITFRASRVVSHEQCKGSVVVWSSSPTQKLTIPYQAQVFFGDLLHSKNLHFYSLSDNRNISKDFSVTNIYQCPVVVFNVSLKPEANNIFSISNFSKPVLLQPNQEVNLLKLVFHSNATGFHMITEMILHTNLSQFRVPLTIYNGKLQVIYNAGILKGLLNFGTLATEETRSLNFTVLNDNPIDILITKFYTNYDGATINLATIEPTNYSSVGSFHRLSSPSQVLLRSKHQASFTLHVKAPKQEESIRAAVILETQNEYLHIPLTLQTTTGNIQIDPSKLVFHDCFPGRVVAMDLHVSSTFQNDLKLRDISFTPNDTRFYFLPNKDKPVAINSDQESSIGWLMFDPLKECKEYCYSALSTDSSASSSWLFEMALGNNMAEIDVFLYSRAWQKWNRLANSEKIANVTMQLNTNKVQGFLFQLQAHFHWPSLIKLSQLIFPLTQIGNTSTSSFVIENPSNLPVLVHIVPAHTYPNVHHLFNSLSPHLLFDDESTFMINKSFCPFIISDIVYEKTKVNIKTAECVLGVRPFKNTTAIFVKPRNKVTVQLSFEPTSDTIYTSYFVIRNNITIVELLRVEGRGGRGDIKLSNRKPGSNTPLTFEMSDKLSRSCEKGHSPTNIQSNFGIKRTFTLRNSGQLPVDIHSFDISGMLCEGYGFKIFDCYPLTLQANESIKVNIIFTPDFTMSKVRKLLTLHTNLMTPVEYIIQANIPSHMLAKCTMALPRPLWEPILFYCVVVMMGFLVVCIIMAAYYESNRTLAAEFYHGRTEYSEGHFDKSKVFDLRFYSSSEFMKSNSLNKRCNFQEACNDSIPDMKTTPLTDPPKPFHLSLFIKHLFQKLKNLMSFNNQKKLSVEHKKKNENERNNLFSCLSSLFKSQNVAKNDNYKKEDPSSTPCRNSSTYQRKSDPDSTLTFRKVDKHNKRQKHVPSLLSSGKSLDAFAEPENKTTNKAKSEGINKLPKQKETRKRLSVDINKTCERNDDSSSTTTDASSLETDDKNHNFVEVMEIPRSKKNKIKQLKSGQLSHKTASPIETTDETTLFSFKQKSKKDGEEVTNTSYNGTSAASNNKVVSKQESNRGRTNAVNNSLKYKKKTNSSGHLSLYNPRMQSKSPPPSFQPPSPYADDLNDVVERAENTVKLRNPSIFSEKSTHSSPIPPSKPVNIAPIGTPSNKPAKTIQSVCNDTTFQAPPVSSFGGRPVAAVGATVRRPWSQAASVVSSPSNNNLSNIGTTSAIANHDLNSHNSFIFPNNVSTDTDSFTFSNFRGSTQNGLHEPFTEFEHPDKQATMMQKLLAERRKRLLEYQNKMFLPNEWSGFERNLSTSQQPWRDRSNLWTSQSYQPNGAGYLSSLTSRYNMLDSQGWMNNSFTSNDGPSWLSSHLWRPTEPQKFGSDDALTYPVFDPFNTLENNGSIWNPTSTGSNVNNGWDVSSAKPSSDNK